MKPEQLLSGLDWSEPRPCETRRGWRYLKTAPATEEITRSMLSDPATFSRMGVSIYRGMVQMWLTPPPDFLAPLQENIVASVASSANIAVPAPEGREFRPYQKAAVSYARGKRGVLFADDMGLGKTVEALGVINDDDSIKSVLVACPLSLKLNWQREILTWVVRDMTVGIVTVGDMTSADIQIVHYDILHRFDWSQTHFDLLIADEAHAVKNGKTRRAQAFRSIPCDRRLALTGTPIENKPEDIFEVLNWVAPDVYPNKWKFLFKYCGAYRGRFGIVTDLNLERLTALNRKLRETVMIRRLKSDVLTELPPRISQVIELSVEEPALQKEKTFIARHRAALEKLYGAMGSAPEGDDSSAVAATKASIPVPFDEMAEIRLATAKAKIPYTLQHIRECIEEHGVKIVVFAHHRVVLEALQREFPHSVLLYGGMRADARDQAVQAFQNSPEVGPFFGSIRVAGEGITLTASSHVVFHEQDWNPSKMRQAADRLHRIGQKQTVLVQHIVLEGSVDARMAAVNSQKIAISQTAIDPK